MAYKTLDKLSYGDTESYVATYEARYHSEFAFHIPVSIHSNPAFFLMTPEVSCLLVNIYKADKAVVKLRSILPSVAIDQFTMHSLIDEILLTNNIEGVHSTRREIEDALDAIARSDKRKRFQGLVQKYSLLRTEDSISLNVPEDIRTIYDELAGNEVREADEENVPDGILFRKGPVFVTTPSQAEIHRGLFPEAEIIRVLKDSLDFLNDSTVDTLCRISIFHYLFGYIHPFYDGNGRTSRFISSYLLSKELDTLIGYRLSYTIKENIQRYYKAFRICNDKRNKGDLTPFLIVFLETILQSMLQLVDALSDRLNKWQYYSKICGDLFDLNEKAFRLYDILIQASLFGSKGISIDDLTHVLEISKSTLSVRLRDISPAELLCTEKDARRKYYRLDLSIIDQMQEEMSKKGS